MNRILFYILELISAVVVGNLGFIMFRNNTYFDDNIFEYLTFSTFTIIFFTLIGILIPGYFYSRLINQNQTLLNGIKSCIIGIIVGLLLFLIYDYIDSDSYLNSYVGGGSDYLPLWSPMIFGIIGFNIGLEKDKTKND